MVNKVALMDLRLYLETPHVQAVRGCWLCYVLHAFVLLSERGGR